MNFTDKQKPDTKDSKLCDSIYVKFKMELYLKALFCVKFKMELCLMHSPGVTDYRVVATQGWVLTGRVMRKVSGRQGVTSTYDFTHFS